MDHKPLSCDLPRVSGIAHAQAIKNWLCYFPVEFGEAGIPGKSTIAMKSIENIFNQWIRWRTLWEWLLFPKRTTLALGIGHHYHLPP